MGQVWEEGLKAWVSVGQAWLGWVRHTTAHNHQRPIIVGPQPLADHIPPTTEERREKQERKERNK